jgi:Fe-S-cluster containining protein
LSLKIDCQQCGVCCTVFDIAALKKKELTPCKYLDENNRCTIYENRPDVCKNYMPDEICMLISTLDKSDKIKVVQKIYGIDNT